MLIQIDAKQLEWRAACWLSNDKVGLGEINTPGVDFHAENQKTFVLPTRTIAKIYLFRTIFRGSGWSFANDPDFMHVSDDPKFWDEINRKFYKKYYGLDRWHHELAQICAARRPIRSPLGAEWLILPKEDGKLPWTVFSNYPVQGTSAHLMMIARISIFRRLKTSGLISTCLLVSTVHDSIVLDVPTELVQRVSAICVQAFDDLVPNVKRMFNIDLPCPFPGEVKVGKDMKNMIDLDKYLQNGV